MKILFQGDSITDAERVRDNEENMGTGYPLLVKACLGYKEPDKYEFVNKGVSGDRVIHIYARMESEIINIKPDVMSILVGVNDAWNECADSPNRLGADKYYKIYDMLISEVKQALPDIKIMIMEPFILKSVATEERWEEFNKEVRIKAKMAKKIAEKYNLPFVELQAGFDKLSQNVETSYWLGDGVHPTPMGHEYIKNEWIKAFKTL